MKSTLVMVLLLSAMIASDALAQYGGGGGFPGGGGTRGGMGGHGMQGSGKSRDRPAIDSGAPVLVQLDQLENDLKLTSQQRDAWNAYADKVLSLADDMTRAKFAARTSSEPTDATAAQQLEQLADHARNRLTAVEDIAAAGKALYAQLSSEQKSIADRRLVAPVLATGVSPLVMGDSRHREGR